MNRRLRTLFRPLDRSYRGAALRPLLIGGMITPVVGGDGGINADTGCQPSILIAVDPWSAMLEGDHLDVYWDTERVATHDVLSEDINERICLAVPGEYIKDGWVEKVFYRLTHAATGQADESGSLRVKVKLELPGGFDRNPALPGHSELQAPEPPADIVVNGVDAEWAQRGFPLIIETYPGRMARDTISLAWGDVVIPYSVSEEEAAGSDPIEIPIDQSTILAAGDSETLVVDYEVYDEVYNFATPRSMRTTVSVEAGAWRLDAPIIGEGSPTIDLGDLESRNVIVHIEARENDFSRGDEVEMTWLGNDKNGEQMTFNASFIIDSLPEIYRVEVPNALIRASLDGSGHATYVLKKANGDPWQSSKRATVRIVGEAPLPAPSIFELIGDTLAPDLERAHVEIPDYGMEAGDFIVLTWLGTKATGSIYLHEDTHDVTGNEADANESLYIPVMGEHISVLKNGTLDVSYNVSNDAWLTASTRRSEHLLVKVSERYAQLPAPMIVEAPDAVLDPELNPDSATLRVGYDGTEAGDLLTWYWQGISEEGSGTDSFPITTGSAGDTLDFTIVRSLIEPNINNEVQVFYTLKLGSAGEFQYSATLDLVIGKLIGELPAPTVPQASAGVLDPMDALSGATVHVSYASMEPQDIVTLVWLGSPDNGSPADQEKPGNVSGQVEFAVPATVVGANIGRDVILFYGVKRYTAVKQSDVLTLSVLPFGDPDKDLPHPAITQADSQTLTLNLASFTGNGTATVARWPFILQGQRVWLRLEGETGSGGAYSITLLDGAMLTGAQASDGLSIPVLRTELEKLGQDTRVTVICNVAFDGVPSEGAALQFPRTVYTFKLHHDWVSPKIVSVKDSEGELNDGGITFDTQVALTGTSTIGAELEILDGITRLTSTRANDSGGWDTTLSALKVKNYSVTAHALDDSGLVSPPRRFEVVANLTPTITQVIDSNGPIANGGTTVETSLTVSGQGSPDQQIELFDGTVSKGTASTDGAGAWSLTVSGLTVASHPLKAKALYGTRPESTVWTVVVAAAVAPTITSIKDSNNIEIPPNGFTVDTSAVLTGSASANLEVEIFDGATSRGKAKANAGGEWTLSLTGLSVGPHDIKVRANYGDNPESAVRKFTVTAVVSPSITKVVDPNGSTVADGASTFANILTLSGKASINQAVEILDGTTSKGTTNADANGDWSRQVSGLGAGSHKLTAKALYASNPVSSPWTVNVLAEIAPVVTSVRDPKNEIPNGETTTATAVTVGGYAAQNQQVEVFDSSVSKGVVSTSGSGMWSKPISGLAVGGHSIQAIARYGDKPASNIRSFNVVSPVPPFVLDPSLITLSGTLYKPSGFDHVLPSPWPAGTTATRTPSSGVPAYTYSSDNASVAMVIDGTVYARANSKATITVRDAQGRSGSYTVQVTGVVDCVGFGSRKYIDGRQAAEAAGFRIPNMNELRAIHSMFGDRWPFGNGGYWSSDPNGFVHNWTKNLVTGQEDDVSILLHRFVVGIR